MKEFGPRGERPWSPLDPPMTCAQVCGSKGLALPADALPPPKKSTAVAPEVNVRNLFRAGDKAYK